jgi:large subunit ribosomal protein L10
MAKLPPKEVLLARMVGGFQAPICGLVNVLQGTIRKLVYALNAVKDKKAEA